MQPVVIACASILLTALPSYPAPRAQPALVSDKDTVAGIEAMTWVPRLPWSPANFIRIRNTTPAPLVLDSLRIPRDSIGDRTYGLPLSLAFAARLGAGEIREYLGGSPDLKARPIRLAAGDSVDLGLFEIGRIAFPVKTTATARLYRPGDSLSAPLAVFAGADSLRFILKAKVVDFIYGVGIVPMQASGRKPWNGERAATADGRAAREARPGSRVLFRLPVRGSVPLSSPR